MTDQEYLWLSALLAENTDNVSAQALEGLEHRGWIKTYINGDFCELTQHGLNALELEEQTRNQVAQQKTNDTARQSEEQSRSVEQCRKNHRHDYAVVIVGAIAAGVVTAITALVKHFINK